MQPVDGVAADVRDVADDRTPTDREAGTREALLRELDEAASVLSAAGAPGPWLAEVEELRARVRSESKMIAVFGAFSAGKSSLINAPLDDPVLVVSPNPTTAAVTQVARAVPGGAEAVIHFKAEEQLWDDVAQAMRFLHRPAKDLEDALRQAAAWKMTEFPPSARRHASFVKAVAAGYAELAPRLGTRHPADGLEVRRYTAEERFACFVHRVDLAHPAAFLQRGAVLVDTPGVDSIHRRHTDVAFGYMQAADAIVFVLYYTHAFSRADREFLRELAQVQDILGTDKLFVVINAVDLATDSDERAAVRDRVVEELRRLGVRRPRVYEVSSQIGLAASMWARQPEDGRFATLLRQRLGLAESDPLPEADRLRAESGVQRLAEDLTAFVESRSLAIAKDAVQRLLQARAADVRRVHQALCAQRAADAATRAAWRAQQRALADEWRGAADAALAGTDEVEDALRAEWEELAFHIGERVRLRFGDTFREAFHPGRFRVAAGRGPLEEAAAELADALARQLSAELRTFALRVQRQVARALAEQRDRMAKRLEDVHADPGLLPEMEDVPALEAGRAQLDPELAHPAFRHFSSARQFFEGGGQQTMQQELEGVFVTAARAEVAGLTDAVCRQAVDVYRREAARLLRAAADGLVQASQSLDEAGTPAEDRFAAWEAAAAWFARRTVTEGEAEAARS
ncbi:dynamin family protein [Alicyclobacillus macrosporangiidus]|uniref:dynamin family protein n=1 Tax=Alicyclobacillus macrosporangiidus TaxID=392015 RepID=UPI00068E99D5|nr:dynamin family protein [Alicyclobacillus macrosporangiidus]